MLSVYVVYQAIAGGQQWRPVVVGTDSQPPCVSFALGPGKDCRSTLHCHNTVALSHLTYQSLYGNALTNVTKCHMPDMCCLVTFGAAW